MLCWLNVVFPRETKERQRGLVRVNRNDRQDKCMQSDPGRAPILQPLESQILECGELVHSIELALNKMYVSTPDFLLLDRSEC